MNTADRELTKRRRPLAVFLTLALLVTAACDREPEPSFPGLLAQGVARAEVGQWVSALEAFEAAVRLAPEEPAAVYDLAVAHYRNGDPAMARDWLGRLPAEVPSRLAARVELLRAKLAYEDGDLAAELAAHREAVRLAPGEAAYLYALEELRRRSPETGESPDLLERALELWPENAFLAAEHALLALESGDAERRARGLEILKGLVRDAGVREIRDYFEAGRQELEAGTRTGLPPALRIAFNLLRPTKRLVHGATELQARLEVLPVTGPLATTNPPAETTSPALRFEKATIPAIGLAAGEKLLAVVRVDDAVDDPEKDGTREAGLAALSDRRLVFLASAASTWQEVAKLDVPLSQLLAGDVDDDERMELVALGAGGLRVWDRVEDGDWKELPLMPELAAGSCRRALLVDFEHDGDLDLLGLGPEGDLLLVTHRGEAGWGAPQPAPLSLDGAFVALAATDLDGDSDQDLVLAGESELVTLRNWRQGEFAIHQRQSLPWSASRLLALEADGDGHLDLLVTGDGGVLLLQGEGAGGLTPVPEQLVGGMKVRDAAIVDADLDGDLDLWVTSGNGNALTLLLNRGGGRFEAAAEPPGGSSPEIAGLLPLDLDGDRDPDLLTWADGQLIAWQGLGAEGQGWLALHLRAPGRKVPRDGRGVRLEISAGEHRRVLELSRPGVIIGLGQDQPALVKATWPNGISEYLFDPRAGGEHTLTLQLRVEGSCPFVYAWDGDGLRFVTDILGLSPVGMLAEPGRYVPADPEEYLRLPDWVRVRGGEVEIAITEELREVLYLDQAELVALDAPDGVDVYNGERWLERPVHGLQPRFLEGLTAPLSVLDDRGREVLDTVRHEDQRYLSNHRGEPRYQGAVAPHRLTVTLPPEIAAAEDPALLLVGWLHWGNTSTNVARSQDPGGAPIFPYLEIPDGAGGWRRTEVEMGLPAGKTKAVVVELGSIFDDLGQGEPRQVRITTDFEVYWDLVAVGSSRPLEAVTHRVERLAPRSAELGWGGFSRWFRPAANGPYLFDYAERRAYPWRTGPDGREIVLSWREHAGHYTAFGSAGDLLTSADDRLVVVGSGEEIRLRFDVSGLPPLPAGWHRTFFLHTEGWEKDGDPNVACGETVEPLPRRGVDGEPCSGLVAVPGAPRDESRRTRWVASDRLERRVRQM